MSECLKTEEFWKAVDDGYRIFEVVYNIFEDYPFNTGDVITYIGSETCVNFHFCRKSKEGQCRGYGIFLTRENKEIKMCMSWKIKKNSDILGCTHLKNFSTTEFIDEKEMVI